MMLLAIYQIYRQYSFTIGGYHFGFVDAEHNGADVTLLQLGPLGQFTTFQFRRSRAVRSPPCCLQPCWLLSFGSFPADFALPERGCGGRGA